MRGAGEDAELRLVEAGLRDQGGVALTISWGEHFPGLHTPCMPVYCIVSFVELSSIHAYKRRFE